MKLIVLCLIITVSMITHVSAGNPFSCKINNRVEEKKQTRSPRVKFKGFAFIGSKRYGLVQIGKRHFEVLAGDDLQGIRITKVTSERLEYLVGNKRKYVLLDSNK